MIRYLLFVLLVLVVELGIIFGLSKYFDADLLTTMFFGAAFFIFFAFLTGSSGDLLSKNAEFAAYTSMGGQYEPKHEKLTLKISPFLIGSILCFIVYLVMSYFAT
jgi:hypothetical protein